MNLYNEVAFTKTTEEEIIFLPGVYLEHCQTFMTELFHEVR